MAAPKGVRTRHQTRMEEDGELPSSLVGRIRALILEGFGHTLEAHQATRIHGAGRLPGPGSEEAID